jgi:hypothetical protein
MSTSAPISPLDPDHGQPAWRQIIALFERNGLQPPPTRLRDELVVHLAWARHGERLEQQAGDQVVTTGEAAPGSVRERLTGAVMDYAKSLGLGTPESRAVVTAIEHARAVVDEPSAWRCFHCDEEFTTQEAAAEHFGKYQDCQPACKIGVEIFRQMEKDLASFQAEDTHSAREFYALGAKHAGEARSAEEKGYARGLKDARSVSVDGDAAVEAIARWLHDEYSPVGLHHTWRWPDFPEDDGRRGENGRVTITPKSAQDEIRHAAKRLLSQISRDPGGEPST